MALPNNLVLKPLQPGRVVRELVAAAPAPGVAPPAAIAIGAARSPFWQDRIDTFGLVNQVLTGVDELQTTADSVQSALQTLAARQALQVTTSQGPTDFDQSGAGVSALQGLATSLATLATRQLPESFSITASLAPTEAAQFERAVKALEALADCCQQRGCQVKETLSNRAFSIIARVTMLRAHLMDRHGVTLDSVLEKLADLDAELIADIATLLDTADAAEARKLLERATDLEPFRRWRDRKVAQDDPHIYAELNRRAALLLAVECLVAHGVEGEAPGDWPPPPPAPPVEIETPARARRAR